MRKFSLIIIAAVLAMLMLTGCVPEEAPPAADPTAQQALNIANTNTGSIQALAARVGTVEGRTAGEVTQAELDALTGQVATLSAKVTELEGTVAELNSTDTGTGTSTGTVTATEVRWRYYVDWQFNTGDVVKAEDDSIIAGPNTYNMGIKSIDPRTVKEAGVYTITLAFVNDNDFDIIINDFRFDMRLEPGSPTLVADTTDVYQISGPFNMTWNLDILRTSSTDACRYVRITSDSTNLKVPKNKSESSPYTIELEFDLVYGA